MLVKGSDWSWTRFSISFRKATISDSCFQYLETNLIGEHDAPCNVSDCCSNDMGFCLKTTFPFFMSHRDGLSATVGREDASQNVSARATIENIPAGDVWGAFGEAVVIGGSGRDASVTRCHNYAARSTSVSDIMLI